MAWSKEILKPSNDLYTLLAPVVFDNVRSTEQRTTTRTRQCYKCMQKINTGEKYINHQYRYDRSITTISFHLDCFNGC